MLVLMMEHASGRVPALEELMAELGWIRRLARALVKDPAVADDIAQDACLLAIQHPPEAGGSLRPWLRRVVLNVVRMRHRAAGRRDAREAAIEPRDVATPAELVERVELQRAVADEVIALSEPYRTTVLLHFVEGLSTGEIARRLGVPDGTVRRRLKVGLDQMRERLRARGDGPACGWLAALVPFAAGSDPAPAATPVLAMKALLAIVVLGMLLVSGAVAWWRHGDRRREPAGAIANRAGAVQARTARDGERTAAIASWIPQLGVSGRRIAGHVTSAAGPVGRAIVRLALVRRPDAVESIAELRAGPDGAFDFGMQPATLFAVSAEVPALTPSSTTIAVADPGANPDQIVLELGACRSRLYGSVLDASGGGIAKARVLSAARGGTESDAAGRYNLCLPDNNSRVRVEADGYGTIEAPIHLFGELSHDFVLAPEAIMVGQVVAGEGQPVAGAQVIASPDDIGMLQHVATVWTTTDGDGRFRIAGIAPGTFQISATADGLGMTTPQRVISRPTTSSRELRLALEPRARLRGRVVIAGRPVSGARVSTPRSDDPAPPVSLSQADGSFVLSGVPFGRAVLTAWPYEVRTPTSLVIERADIGEVVLDVRALASLRGHVTRNGKPVAGAEVSCAPCQLTTRSDRSGAYVLEGLPAGKQPISVLSLDARAFAEEHVVALATGEERTLDVELDHAGEVSGTVVDAEGRPVPRVYVRLEVANGVGDLGEAMTNGSGAFDCWGMLGGEYLAAVYPSPQAGWAFAPAGGERHDAMHIPRDGTLTGVKLAIRNERLAIRGVVVDDRGADVPDVHVEAVGRRQHEMGLQSVTSDAAGRFELGDLARGTYSLHARAADGSETEALDIPAGAETVTITLARPGAIEGTLAEFSTTPVVQIYTETRDMRTGSRALIDGDRFSASGLPPGRYTVQAQVGTELDGQSVEVRSGQTTRLTLRRRALGKLEGRLTEHDSKAPLAGVRCDANLSVGGDMGGLPPDAMLWAVTDATGHFAMAAPVGQARVFCSPPNGLSVAGADIDVGRTTTSVVELVAVRDTSGLYPGNPGFGLASNLLPITVTWVEPGGPAAATGLAPGDRVIAIDGAALQGMLSVGALTLLGNHRPGTTVTVGIERGGAPLTIKIIVGTTRD